MDEDDVSPLMIRFCHDMEEVLSGRCGGKKSRSWERQRLLAVSLSDIFTAVFDLCQRYYVEQYRVVQQWVDTLSKTESEDIWLVVLAFFLDYIFRCLNDT